MTEKKFSKEELEAWYGKLAQSTKEKMDQWKDGLDEDTRREVRKYWASISVITFLLGYCVGKYLF